MGIVYLIKNNKNGKVYIGQTVRTLEQRWKSHISSSKSGSPFRFHAAIRKHGIDGFSKQILFEHDDINLAKEKEEHFISEYKSMSKEFGYNARPGNTGGWVVKDENFDLWKERISLSQQGERNGNALSISNEKIKELCIELSKELGRVPSFRQFYTYYKDKDIKIPRHWTQYRFEGSYKNLVEIVELETGLLYNPYHRTKNTLDKLKSSMSNRKWYHCDELKKNILILEENLDRNYKWEKGKKTWE